jgi:hypothetical protein
LVLGAGIAGLAAAAALRAQGLSVLLLEGRNRIGEDRHLQDSCIAAADSWRCLGGRWVGCCSKDLGATNIHSHMACMWVPHGSACSEADVLECTEVLESSLQLDMPIASHRRSPEIIHQPPALVLHTGGRIHSLQLPCGSTIDLGASWIHGNSSSNPIANIAAAEGLQLIATDAR